MKLLCIGNLFFKSRYVDENQYMEYVEKFDVLGKKINKFLQMVIMDHLDPRKKINKKLGTSNDVPNYLIDGHRTP